MEFEKYDITVVICCYNSSSRLQATLEHLVKQQLTPEVNWEVVIVDNNSSDRTADYAIEIWKTFATKVNLNVVYELIPGLSNARKSGINAAKGEMIIFCDDDNWLDKNYLQISYDFMRNNPQVGVLGGKGIAVSSVELPDWFSSYQGDYAVGVQNIESGQINDRRYLWGSGMVVRRKDMLSLYQSGFCSLLTGRKGTDLMAGDDSEICKWFLLVGKDLYYNQQLVFKHFIEPFRLSIEYNKKLNLGFTQSHVALNHYNFIISLFRKKDKLSFSKVISLFVIFLFERDLLKIKTLMEFFNKTPFVFHKQTKEVLKARKLFFEKE